jgi:hypothetical protein
MINIDDPRFREIDRRLLFGEFDGKRIGVVLATMNPNFDRFALNVNETNRLRAGKAEGKIDEAVVVGVKVNGDTRTYMGQMPLEEAMEKLSGIEPRNGRMGAFWSLPQGFIDAPF